MGKLFDESGEPLYSCWAEKGQRRYRYFISKRLVRGIANLDDRGWRCLPNESHMTWWLAYERFSPIAGRWPQRSKPAVSLRALHSAWLAGQHLRYHQRLLLEHRHLLGSAAASCVGHTAVTFKTSSGKRQRVRREALSGHRPSDGRDHQLEANQFDKLRVRRGRLRSDCPIQSRKAQPPCPHRTSRSPKIPVSSRLAQTFSKDFKPLARRRLVAASSRLMRAQFQYTASTGSSHLCLLITSISLKSLEF